MGTGDIQSTAVGQRELTSQSNEASCCGFTEARGLIPNPAACNYILILQSVLPLVHLGSFLLLKVSWWFSYLETAVGAGAEVPTPWMTGTCSSSISPRAVGPDPGQPCLVEG